MEHDGDEFFVEEDDEGGEDEAKEGEEEEVVEAYFKDASPEYAECGAACCSSGYVVKENEGECDHDGEKKGDDDVAFKSCFFD